MLQLADVSLRQGCASLLSTTHPSCSDDPSVPCPGHQSCRRCHEDHSHAIVHRSSGRQVQGTVPASCRPCGLRQRSDFDGQEKGRSELGWESARPRAASLRPGVSGATSRPVLALGCKPTSLRNGLGSPLPPGRHGYL